MGNETYDFVFDVTGVTDKAIQVTDGVELPWLPKSQVECLSKPLDHIEVGDTIKVFIQGWLAKEKGLI